LLVKAIGVSRCEGDLGRYVVDLDTLYFVFDPVERICFGWQLICIDRITGGKEL
jgi:hypothetical protein